MSIILAFLAGFGLAVALRRCLDATRPSRERRGARLSVARSRARRELCEIAFELEVWEPASIDAYAYWACGRERRR